VDLFDALHGQRAQRALKPDPVPEELIEQVLRAATHAPSAQNMQPWGFVVVTDATIRLRIAEITQRTWSAGGREYAEAHLNRRMFAEVDTWVASGLADAPVHIVVCGDTALVPKPLLASSIFPAVQNLLLAANGLGLGSLLSTLPVSLPADFAALLDLPSHVLPLALVPIGYPARPLGPPRRIDVTEKTYRDRWGSPWLTRPGGA
jgi:nitroreductase